MKFKKSRDPDDGLRSLDMRRVFIQGDNMPCGCSFETIEEFVISDYDVHTYNRKRYVASYWKEMYTHKYNDGLCIWNGEDT